MSQTRLNSRREESLQSSRVSQTERRLVSAIRGVWLSACGKERRTRGGRVTPFPRIQKPSGVNGRPGAPIGQRGQSRRGGSGRPKVI